MIEKIAEAIAKKLIISKNNTYDPDELDILKYGMECILNLSIPMVFYLIFSLKTHLFFQMLIWLCTFLLFRNSIGGYHANSHIKCIFYSTLYGLIFIKLISLFDNLNIFIELSFLTVVFFTHIYIPPIIDNPQQKMIYYKKSVLFLLTILSVLTMLLRFVNVSFSVSILLGIVSAELLFIIQLFVCAKEKCK